MENQEALAAGQGGAESIAAPGGPVAPGEPQDAASDGARHRRAVSRLTGQLDIADGLLGRCEHLAALPKGDRIKPIFAAARLLRSNARIAQAIAQLTQIEQLRRAIVEHIQTPAPVLKHSNSNFDDARDALMKKMLRYMEVMADTAFDPALEETAAQEKSNAREKENPAAATETGAGPA